MARFDEHIDDADDQADKLGGKPAVDWLVDLAYTEGYEDLQRHLVRLGAQQLRHMKHTRDRQPDRNTYQPPRGPAGPFKPEPGEKPRLGLGDRARKAYMDRCLLFGNKILLGDATARDLRISAKEYANAAAANQRIADFQNFLAEMLALAPDVRTVRDHFTADFVNETRKSFKVDEK